MVENLNCCWGASPKCTLKDQDKINLKTFLSLAFIFFIILSVTGSNQEIRDSGHKSGVLHD